MRNLVQNVSQFKHRCENKCHSDFNHRPIFSKQHFSVHFAHEGRHSHASAANTEVKLVAEMLFIFKLEDHFLNSV